MVEGSAALWFGASGFEVLDVVDDGVELVVAVQTEPPWEPWRLSTLEG